MIVQGHEITSERSLSTHTVVVGSGSGGGLGGFLASTDAEKLRAALETGSDTVMDLSTGFLKEWPLFGFDEQQLAEMNEAYLRIVDPDEHVERIADLFDAVTRQRAFDSPWTRVTRSSRGWWISERT